MAKTMVMIHGMWGNNRCWDHYKAFFEAQGYTCITPILRYHDVDPASEPDPRLGQTGLLDYCADLEHVIRGLDETPILIGHSMGGLLAQILASRGCAEALVLLSPAAPAGIVALTPSVIKSFWRILCRWGFWRRPHRQTLQAAIYSTLHKLSAEQQQTIYAQYVFESGRAATEIGFSLFDRHHAARVDAQHVTCPVLVASGAQDRITPPSIVRKVATKYPQARYELFPDNAHWVLGEDNWADIAQCVLNWVGERHLPQTSPPMNAPNRLAGFPKPSFLKRPG